MNHAGRSSAYFQASSHGCIYSQDFIKTFWVHGTTSFPHKHTLSGIHPPLFDSIRWIPCTWLKMLSTTVLWTSLYPESLTQSLNPFNPRDKSLVRKWNTNWLGGDRRGRNIRPYDLKYFLSSSTLCNVHPRCSSTLCIHQEQSGLPYWHIVHTGALYYNIRKKCMYSVLKWTIDTLWTGHKYTHYHIMLKADQPHYTAHCP